jgi:phosphohistidine phosphatase SixA
VIYVEIIFFHAGEHKEKSDKEGAVTQVLTRRSAKLTERAADGISRLRPKKTKLEVWSNLVPHLTQTADILAEQLDVKTKIVNAIGQDDMGNVLKILSEHAKEKCIVLVGEGPYLDLWSKQLIGHSIPLNSYSAAGFSVSFKDDSPTEFLWFASDSALLRIR